MCYILELWDLFLSCSVAFEEILKTVKCRENQGGSICLMTDKFEVNLRTWLWLNRFNQVPMKLKLDFNFKLVSWNKSKWYDLFIRGPYCLSISDLHTSSIKYTIWMELCVKMRKGDFVFVIHLREENRVTNKENGVTFRSQEQIWRREITAG